MRRTSVKYRGIWSLVAGLGLTALACGDGKTPNDVTAPGPNFDHETPAGLSFVSAGPYVAGTDIRTPGSHLVNGACWQTAVNFNVGTGLINPFISMQRSGEEHGFNTDAALPFDTKRPQYTDALPLNVVPFFIETVTGCGGNNIWREFIGDYNESSSGTEPRLSIDVWDLYLCKADPTKTNANPATYTPAQFQAAITSGECTLIYDLDNKNGSTASLLMTTEHTSGSGQTLDQRILIPTSVFGAANAQCPYNPTGAPCGWYLVLYTHIGGLGGTFITDATFEEYSTVNRPVPPQLILVKNVINDNGGTATADDWLLSANGTTNTFDFSGNPAPPGGATGSVGPNVVLPNVQYTLSESVVSGYAQQGNWSCNGGTFVAPNKITLVDGQIVTCTVTNNDVAPQLTLEKQVINDNGGTAFADEWTLTATGTGGFSGTPSPADALIGSVGPNAVTAGVQYTLSESGGPASGYSTTGVWACSGDVGGFVSPDKITLQAGQSATCRIVNNDQAGALILIKHINNLFGGAAVVTDFGITTDAGALNFGAAAQNGTIFTYTAATITGLSAGTYNFSELDVAGYTEGSWSCSPTAATTSLFSGGSVAIANGVTVTCQITNTEDQPPVVEETAYARGHGGATCFTTLGISNNWGWGITVNVNDLPETYEIWAGAAQCNTANGTLVGTLTVSIVGGKIRFTYSTPGQTMTTVHVYVSTTGFPANVSPGQFPYSASPNSSSVFIDTINAPAAGTTIYFIAHAVIAITP